MLAVCSGCQFPMAAAAGALVQTLHRRSCAEGTHSEEHGHFESVTESDL